MRYGVYGDYGFSTEECLYETDDMKQATDWLYNYCRNDLGGYTIVEAAYFSESGEYITIGRVDCEDM